MSSPSSRRPSPRVVPEEPVFLGRGPDLAALRAELARGSRLITIAGPPGIGKTSVAVRLFEGVRDEWESAWMLDLSGARAVDGMCDAVARRLGLAVPRAAPDVVSSIGRALAGHGRTLLVLDNLEQLLPEVAELLVAWLSTAPDAHFVAATREVLNLGGERVHVLPPLPEAAELFLERARRARPGWTPTPEERRAVDALVARLDGIPLAVELAATGAAGLSPAALRADLELHVTAPGAGARAQTKTMEEAILWSWDRLDPVEQAALAAASVFCGGGGVDSVEAVIGAVLPPGAPAALDVVQALCDKSMLRVVRAAAAARVTMYQAIRSFAAGELEASGDAARVHHRHARHYVELADGLERAGGLARVEGELGPDRENYDAVLARVEAPAAGGGERVEAALRAAAILDALSAETGLSAPQLRRLDVALERAGGCDPALVGRALVVRATTLQHLARMDHAEADLRAALAIADDRGDDALSAAAQIRLSSTLYHTDRAAEAAERARAAVELHRAAKDHRGEVLALQQRGMILSSIGLVEQGVELHREALALSRQIGYAFGALRSEAFIGVYHLERCAHAEAHRHWDASIEQSYRIGALRQAMNGTSYRALTYLDEGRFAEALEDCEVAGRLAQELGNPLVAGRCLSMTAAAKAEMGDTAGAEHAAARAEGMLERFPVWLRCMVVLHGCVDLARSREATAAGRVEEAERHLRAAKAKADAARAPDADGGSLADRMDDARFALRILGRSYARAVGGDAPGSAGRVELLAAPDGSWFRVNADPPVDLAKRAPLRRIFAALCARHVSAPGAPVSAAELISLAWPGERLPRAAAQNRLHVALATLRSSGLREILVRGAEGYLLHPRTRLAQRG